LRPSLSSYFIFGLLPFHSVFSMICSSGFTQVCPLDNIACPDDTEMICPPGAETQFMESLDRNGESGCQCIPDFLISHVKDKAESRAKDNVVPDIFKKIKIRIGERNCKCNLKIIPAGDQIDSKSTVKCDKKCSGTIEGLTLEAKSGNLYNATIQVMRGKGKVSGTLNKEGPSRVPSSPACTCVEKKESQGGPESVENEVTFSENGETFVQTDSYNPITREAKIMVPAHGDFEKTTYIMLGMSSDSRLAGKMIVSSGKSCSLEDIPAFIDVEGMMVDGNHQKIDARRQVEVKQYQVRANTWKASEEEYNELTDSMKEECKGKSILVSTTEIIDEDQFLRKSMANFSSIVQRSNGVNRNGCRNVFYGCSVSSPRHCIRWTYQGLGTTAQPSNQDLIRHIYNGVDQYCTTCCLQENTLVFPCRCIQNEQTFSTAFAIARERDGWGFDCLKRSNFCRWTEGAQYRGCRYTVDGSCSQAQECPWDPCPNQDCTTPSTSTTPTTITTTV